MCIVVTLSKATKIGERISMFEVATTRRDFRIKSTIRQYSQLHIDYDISLKTKRKKENYKIIGMSHVERAV